MGDNFRILLVDDHQDIRTALRANLETLGENIDLVDAPTGEEAILEVVGTGVDLLIADIGLPGLSGLEVFTKLKNTYPEMQVILMTGLEDEDIREQIYEADVEAYFFKPINMPEFLNAVRQTMGLEPVNYHTDELPKLIKKPLHNDLTARVADLRGELGAISALVIHEPGVIAAETGIIPDTVYESRVLPLLLQSFRTTNQISSALGKSAPEGVWYFNGENHDLFWQQIDNEYALVVITTPVTQKTDLTWVLTMLDLAAKETAQVIAAVEGKPAHLEEKSAEQETSSAQKRDNGKVRAAQKSQPPPEPEELDEKLEQEMEEGIPEESEVHEFWKAATLETEILRIESPDSLTYEQAKKLGLTPGD